MEIHEQRAWTLAVTHIKRVSMWMQIVDCLHWYGNGMRSLGNYTRRQAE